MNAAAPSPTRPEHPATETPGRRRRLWAPPAMIVAVVAVVVAFGFGVRGLLGNPVSGTDGHGVSTLRGSFEPFPCPTDAPRCAQGYVQAGGRSVFVRFPPGCPAPGREQAIEVRASPDHALGSGGYLARECARG